MSDERTLGGELLTRGLLVLVVALVVVYAGRAAGYGGSDLPLLNALLNGTASVLLVLGLVLIKKGRRAAHRAVMVVATLVSAWFLCGYLYYHFQVQAEAGPTPFRREGPIKTAYYVMLASHVLLAMVNLPMILRTLWLAHRGRWSRHRRLARWTWPIWFYVSVTGVLVYLALYHWNAPPA